MTSSNNRRPASGMSAEQRRLFLNHLGQSCNVSASAKVAGISSAIVYDLRRRSTPFRAAWQKALCEGYARVEAMLLEEALTKASGNILDSTLKARAHKLRVWNMVLTHHRANVRGVGHTTIAKAHGGRKRSKTELHDVIATRIERIRENLNGV